MDIRPLRVVSCGGNRHLAWAEGHDFMLPTELAGDQTLFRPVAGGVEVRAPEAGAPSLAPWAERLKLRNAFIEHPPTSTRLPFAYQKIPVFLRDMVAKTIGRIRRRQKQRQWARFPLWPLDLSADFLQDLAAGAAARPSGPTPVILSHDLDTEEGLDTLVRRFLPLEESAGARSVSFVPVQAFPLDHGLLGQVVSRGHGLGIHGYDHNNRTPFCPPGERQQRLAAARGLIGRYGILGYRAPSLVRTEALLRDLAAFYRFDSSIPTTGGAFPQPNNGCASARPFLTNGIWELPISMPRDAALWFLGYPAKAILETWKQCAAWIAASGGVVVLLTHCERRFSGNGPLWETYAAFLSHLAGDGRYAFSTPQQVLGNSL